MSDDNKTYTTKPTSQLDLEARREAGYARVVKVDVDPNEVDAPYAVEGNDLSAYVGVDRDRMNYANDTEKPLKGDGVEDKVAEELLGDLAFGKDEEEKREQTLGGGSSEPLVYGTTSGDDVQHKVVDRKALAKAADSESDSPTPAKKAAAAAPKPPTASQ